MTIAGHQGKVPVSIHDMTGKLVQQHVVSGATAELSIAKLESGVYLLSAETKRGIEVLRFVKE